MAVWLDTSAVYALIDADDQMHSRAADIWERLGRTNDLVFTSNYVLVEALALLGRRIGLEAVRSFQTEFVPALQVFWVDELLHKRAMSALLTSGLRDLSLVDCVSFELMRQLGIQSAFAFDSHFTQQGFDCL